MISIGKNLLFHINLELHSNFQSILKKRVYTDYLNYLILYIIIFSYVKLTHNDFEYINCNNTPSVTNLQNHKLGPIPDLVIPTVLSPISPRCAQHRAECYVITHIAFSLHLASGLCVFVVTCTSFSNIYFKH